MSISRSQIPNQIDAFDEGGDVTFTDENAKELSRLIKMADGGDSEAERLRQEAISELGGDFDTNFPKYEQRLKSMFAPPRRDMNIYDLATQLGAGLLAAPNIGGRSLAVGLSAGFQNISKASREEEERDRLQRQQIGMKAFELARQDERSAIEFLNKINYESAKKNPSLATKDYIVTSDIPLSINDRVYEKGDVIPLTETEAYTYRTSLKSAGTGGGGNFKVTSKGDIASYMTEDKAKKYLKGMGMDENNPNYEMILSEIIAPSEEQVGKPIIKSGSYLQLTPFTDGQTVKNIFLSPVSGQKPMYRIYAEGRLEEIAKTEAKSRDDLLATRPAVLRAMKQILDGKVKTGKFTEVTLPYRKFVVDLFGTTDPALSGLEDIIAVSNYLAPKMRPKGSGSTSDMEFRAYQSALLQLEKTPLANYIALYAFLQTINNGAALNSLEKKLLSNEEINDIDFVNQKLNEANKGIFKKLPDEIIQLRNEKGSDDEEYQRKTAEFWDSLEKGDVFDNSDGIYRDKSGNTPVFIVKGWEKLGWGNSVDEG